MRKRETDNFFSLKNYRQLKLIFTIAYFFMIVEILIFQYRVSGLLLHNYGGIGPDTR